MRQQLAAFQNVLNSLHEYSRLLKGAAMAVRSGDRSEDLIVSLMRLSGDILPPDMVERLLAGSNSAAKSAGFIKAQLAQPDVLQAFMSTLTHIRSLDKELEMTLDLQSPNVARVPPPYRFFAPVVAKLQDAFPREVGSPLETPQSRQFQRHLETAENPWRR